MSAEEITEIWSEQPDAIPVMDITSEKAWPEYDGMTAWLKRVQAYSDNQQTMIERLENTIKSIKDDLVKWSRHHDPPEEETQIHLWCSMNRIIGDHFGTDWMDEATRP